MMFAAELKRRVQISWSYRFNTMSNVVMWLLIFPSMMLMFSGLSENYGDGTGGIEESLVGYLVWYVANGVPQHISWLSAGFMEGSISRVFIAPRLSVSIIVTRLCTQLLMSFIEAIVIGLPLMLIYQINFHFSWIALLVFTLSIICLIGVGIGFSGLVLIFKQISSFVSVIFLIALFATGAILPLDTIKGFVLVENLFPPALSISMLRELLLNGIWVYPDLLILCIQAVSYVVLGMFLFWLCWRLAVTSDKLTSH